MPHRKACTADIEQRLLIDAILPPLPLRLPGYAQASLKRRLASALVQFDCKDAVAAAGTACCTNPPCSLCCSNTSPQVSDMFQMTPVYFQALRQEVVLLLRTYPSLKVRGRVQRAGKRCICWAIPLQEEGLA